MVEKKQERYADVKQVGNEITSLVAECQKLFEAVEDSSCWHAYLEYIDEIIIRGMPEFYFISLSNVIST